MKMIVIGGAATLLLAAVPIARQMCCHTSCYLHSRGSRFENAKAECHTVATAVIMYLIDIGRSAPADGMDLSVLLIPPSAGGGANGPYLETADLLDPWDHPYVVRSPGQVNYTFDIVCYGADGKPGGDGEDKDLTN
jgi:general secretion pathway protein G